MPERVPSAGERIGFVDDAYNDRTGVVAAAHEFFHQVMLYVRPDGEWDTDELGDDGTITLTLEECYELEPESEGSSNG